MDSIFAGRYGGSATNERRVFVETQHHPGLARRDKKSATRWRLMRVSTFIAVTITFWVI